MAVKLQLKITHQYYMDNLKLYETIDDDWEGLQSTLQKCVRKSLIRKALK